ncbi:hypothetical protein [Muribaculum intestinale]|uniref:hypothetical protein n=1 Tax=Muribaculum intestinale TaxID=1796646 RepID=UPI0025B018A8|nr:hypothetical protein [Muribaculum intestinale]
MNAYYDSEDVFEAIDISEVHSVNDIIEFIEDYFGDEIELDVEVENESDFDRLLNVAYDDDIGMDRKIEVIKTIIGLVLDD